MSKSKNKDEAKEIHVRYYDREPTKDTGHAVKLPMATANNYHEWNFKTVKRAEQLHVSHLFDDPIPGFDQLVFSSDDSSDDDEDKKANRKRREACEKWDQHPLLGHL